MSQQQQQQTGNYLKAQVKIGSCKGPVSYKPQQQVFHHDDVPTYARERKEEVKEWAKSKILTGDNSWKKTMKIERPVYDKKRMENHVKDRKGAYQYNFRAESLDPLRNLEPFDKPTKFHFSAQPESLAFEVQRQMQEGGRVTMGTQARIAENPNNVKLLDAERWKHSTYFTARDREVDRNAYTVKAQEHCKTRREQFVDPSKYVSPIESTRRLQETIRERKLAGTFTWKQLITRDASLDEPVDRTKLVNRFPAERPRYTVVSKHSGVWAMNPQEGRFMWSDTGSYQYHDTGDVRVRMDPDAYSYAGPGCPTRNYQWTCNVESR